MEGVASGKEQEPSSDWTLEEGAPLLETQQQTQDCSLAPHHHQILFLIGTVNFKRPRWGIHSYEEPT